MHRGAPLLIFVAIVADVATASAEPYFAQRQGYRCSKCHVNGTGGGMRTAFGRQWAATNLAFFARAPDGLGDDIPARRRFWAIDPALNDHVTVGADIRVNNVTTLSDDTQNTFANPESNAYVSLEALQFLTAYLDLSLAEGNVEPREAFLMLHGGGFRLKGGLLLQPYGLRIWGEEQFIRSETGFNYASPDLGIEAGFEYGPFGIFVAVTNGTGGGLDVDRDKEYSAVVEWAGRGWRIGGSAAYNRTEATEDALAGGFVGLTLGRLTLLAEADVLRTFFFSAERAVDGLVLFGEADFLVARGLNLKAIYGYHDPSLAVDENERFNVTTAIEFFPTPSFVTRVLYDLRESVPQDEVGNADLILVELHLYL